MAHRATLYVVTVSTRNKPKELHEFGDLDGQGIYLAEFLRKSVFDKDFSSETADGNRDVKCPKCEFDEPDLKLVLTPGERGVRADIRSEQGLEFEQKPDHVQVLRCGSLLRLPRNEQTGWWAAHANHNRRVKGLVEAEMVKRFSDAFPELVLRINPAVNSAAYEAALDRGDLLSATLLKYEKPSDISEGDKWAADDTGLKVRLDIKPDRGKRLVPTLVKRAFKGDRDAFGKVVAFGDIDFDSAKIEVELANGTTRTFNLENPESGLALSEDMDVQVDGDGNPDEESVFEELQRVVSDLG